MPYDWKIELDGVDITASVAGFTVTADMAQFAREMVLEIGDPALYAAIDVTRIPEEPTVEIWTKVADTWFSQGKYFIERPALSSDIDREVVNGLWGRSETARLAAPFAARVSKMWSTDTTFLAIVAEMCAAAGLSWSDDQCAIDDFYVFAYTYQCENAYPIDVIAELAELAGAVVTCDRENHLRIVARDYSPAAAAAAITDADWVSLTESPEWPDFGNRVRIVAAGGLADFGVQVLVPEPCLPANGSSRAKLLARVTDPDGNPVNGAVVTWSADATDAALDREASNTTRTALPIEEVRSTSRYQVTLAMPPALVLGIWAYADFRMRENLAAGATIDGNVVTLAAPLTYCDQLVRAQYLVDGVAVNYLTAGDSPEDVTVTAAVESAAAEGDVFVGNDCACPASLTLSASPSSIELGAVSELVACAEESGPVADGRIVYLYERSTTPHGALTWTRARLGTVVLRDERATAVNDVAGLTQCDTAHAIASGSVEVRRVTDDGTKYGANLYSAHAGKRITLTTELATGEALAVTYTAVGCARNWFRGDVAGTAYFRAWVKSNREAGIEAETTVRVDDPADPLSGDTPYDYVPDGYGGGGGDNDGLEDPEFGCIKSDGTVSQCAGGADWATQEICCESGGVIGCFPRSQCDEYSDLLGCAPERLSDTPGSDPLARFDAALAAGCSCAQACQAELSIYGTTQGFDGGSLRAIDEILVEDQGLALIEDGDNSAYWTAHAALRQEALDACIADCEAAEFTCSPDNPEVIGDMATVDMAVVGGVAPFTWSIDADKFELASAGPTSSRLNTVAALAGACGSVGVTATDARGEQVTCTLRHVNGQWNYIGHAVNYDDCVTKGDRTDGSQAQGGAERIEGRYRVYEERTIQFKCSLGGAYIDQCTCDRCSDIWGSQNYETRACITVDCPPTPPHQVSRASHKCCLATYTDGVETNLVYCLEIYHRSNYEWGC